jgi:hypothetical protein
VKNDMMVMMMMMMMMCVCVETDWILLFELHQLLWIGFRKHFDESVNRNGIEEFELSQMIRDVVHTHLFKCT